MGRAWLGKYKGALGVENPYPKADQVDRIPPTADVSNVSRNDGASVPSKLDWVNDIRQELKLLVNAIDRLPTTQYSINASKHFSEARFWYGFELGNMRDH